MASLVLILMVVLFFTSLVLVMLTRHEKQQDALIICLHGRRLENGCPFCLGPDDWHLR